MSLRVELPPAKVEVGAAFLAASVTAGASVRADLTVGHQSWWQRSRRWLRPLAQALWRLPDALDWIEQVREWIVQRRRLRTV